MTQPQKIQHIITKSAEYFGIEGVEFTTSFMNKGDLFNKKPYVVYILSQHTACTQREISKLMGYADHSNVSYVIRNMKDALSGESYGNEKTKMIYNELIKYIDL